MKKRDLIPAAIVLSGALLLAACFNSSARRPGRYSRHYALAQPASIRAYSAKRAAPASPSGAQQPLLAMEQRVQPGHNTEAYDRIVENPFLTAESNPLSTFSIDVDTASYANVRRFLSRGMLPPRGAVRIEELINYFPYEYKAPTGKTPFAVNVETASAPWNRSHRLVRIGLKGKEVQWSKRPPCNLVFLLDVSGSMSYENKLPLLKRALALLVDKLTERDRVTIVVYAGAAGLVLPPTPGNHRQKILAALGRLQAGGSTNGGQGIKLAYQMAVSQFIKGGSNRVILATDGDFNVGTTSRGELLRLIARKAKSGVYLSVLGFGMGNYKDAMLEKISNRGDGNYSYIDTIAEARKVLVEQLTGTLITIAKDVKIQVEWNPAQVQAYRLIGYENRMLRKEDFNNDKKDAGDIGAGHTVTAIYEVVPKGQRAPAGTVDKLRYQSAGKTTAVAKNGELMFLKLRYKPPKGGKSTLVTFPVRDPGQRFAKASADFQFAASVAAFGMLLRGSKWKGTSTYADVLKWAHLSRSSARDPRGYRAEFLKLVQRASTLKRD
ncbi:MAG: VWA domain-containing protein [bacterium]